MDQQDIELRKERIAVSLESIATSLELLLELLRERLLPRGKRSK